MNIHQILAFCSLFLLVTVFGGCLVYETVEYHVNLNPDGKSGTIHIKYNNIESSAVDSSKQNEDFNELLSKWKGDNYLLDRMNDGVYIKERRLTLAHGILVWQESGIFSDVQKMKDGVSYEDTTHITLSKDETVLSTNGVVTMSKDSTVIVWPPHTRDFQIKVQQQDFKPTSNFANRFKRLKKRM